MTEKSKNELMFLQNEILGDIKNVETKLDNKIFKISSSFEGLKDTTEKKVNNLENSLKIMLEKIESLKEGDSYEKQMNSKMNLLNKKIDDYFSRIDSKIIILQNDLKDSCYKYDKAISNNFQVPGLIGERCQFSSLKSFLEFCHKKINESLRLKEQQNIDYKRFKEKLDGIILKNKTQLQTYENNIDAYNKENDNKCQGRFAIIEERINSLRVENGKYSFELVNKCNNFDEKFTKIDEMLNNSFKQYNEEMKVFKDMFKDINDRIKNFQEEYHNFQEKIKLFNGLNKNVQDIQNNINKYNMKFNQINNKFLVIKKEINEKYEEMKNKSNTNININNNNRYDDNFGNHHIDINNINEYKPKYIQFYSQKDLEEEINSLNTSKQYENMQDNILNKLALKKKDAKSGEINKKIHKNNHCYILRSYGSKKKNKLDYIDDSYLYTKINDIIFDSKFLRNSNYIDNSSMNEYYNQNYRIKRTKNLYNNRIRSGRISKNLFSNNDNNIDEKTNQISRNSRNKIRRGNSLPGDYDLNENIKEDTDNKKESTLFPNMHKSQTFVRKKLDNDSSEILFPPGHKYLFLDEKINILSNVMVDSLNKLIFEINKLKNNNKQNTGGKHKDNSVQKKKLIASLLDKKVLFNSPSNRDVKNYEKVNIENQSKHHKIFKIKDNQTNKISNKG